MTAKKPDNPEAPGIKLAPPPVTSHTAAAPIGDLQSLIEKNIKWSQLIYEQNKKIQHRFTLMVIGNYLRLAFLIIPVILGAIYLPALLKPLINTYSELLGGSPGAANQGKGAGNINPEQIKLLLQTLQ